MRALNRMARRIQRGKTSQLMEQMATTNTGSFKSSGREKWQVRSDGSKSKGRRM